MSLLKEKSNVNTITTTAPVTDRGDRSQARITSSKIQFQKTENMDQIKEFTRYTPGSQMPKDQCLNIFYNFLTFISLLTIYLGIPLGLTFGIRYLISVGSSLFVAAAPPIFWVAFHFVKDHKIDELCCISGLGYLFCGAVSFINGSEQTFLIRYSAVIAAIGVICLLTLIPIKSRWFVMKPLTCLLADKLFININYQWVDREGYAQEENVLDWLNQHIVFYRWSMRLKTAGWGILLIFELIVCVLFVEVGDSSIEEINEYNHIVNGIFVGFMAIVTLVTCWYISMLEKSVGKKWTEENDFTHQFKT